MTDWSTTSGDGFELFFGYRDEEAFSSTVEQLVTDGVASGIAKRNATLWGPDAESEAGKRLAWVGLAEESRVAGRRDRGPARRARRPGLLPHRAVRHGRVLARTRGHLRHPRRRADRAGLLRPRLRARRPGRPPREHGRRGLQQVRRHRRDRQPEARLRAGVPRRRLRAGGPHHRGHRPGLAARRVRHRGGLPRLPRRPRRRRSLLGADRLRAGAQRAGRRRHRPPARRGGGHPAAARGRRPRQPGAAARCPARRGQPRRRRQGGARRQGLRDRRFRRLGRAADRRVDREERQGHPAGRRTLPRRAELLAQHAGRGAGHDRLRRTHGRAAGLRLGRRGRRASLGAQMLLWEYATAVAGRIIGINPFDQPDVESAKQAARDMLEGGGETPVAGVHRRPRRGLRHRRAALRREHRRRRRGHPARPDRPRARLPRRDGLPRPRPAGPPRRTCATTSPSAPDGRPRSAGVRASCTRPGSTTRADHPPASTSRSRPSRCEDLEIPGRPFTFGGFISAQAIGDASVLADHGRPVLRLHLTDQKAGLGVLRETLR